MNKNAADVMMDAPGYVSDKQLEELNIRVVAPAPAEAAETEPAAEESKS